MKRPPRGHGFTLIELMIALALFGAIAPVAGAAIVNGVRTWRETQRDSQRRREARGALNVLARDLRRFFPGPGKPFHGAAGEIEFLAARPVAGGADPAACVARRVVYRTTAEGWERVETAVRPDDEAPPARWPLPGRVQFQFGELKTAPTPQWVWADRWSTNEPPELLRVVLVYEGGRGDRNATTTIGFPGRRIR